MEAINKEEDRINAIQKPSYRSVVTQDQKKINNQPVHTRQQEYPTRSNYGRVNTNINERRNVLTCWTCHKEGHLSRNCGQRRQLQCYECGTEGHIRRNCPRLTCQRCSMRGHTQRECYIDLERIKMRHENQWRRDSTETRSNWRSQSNRYENRTDNARYSHRNRDGRNIAVIRDDDAERDGQDTAYPNDNVPSLGEMMGARE